ncbi:MAG: hypothetical protein QNJ97_16860 [Myxococcota bacterium]|nr:hypothetical protein [Myxococcota bacterium]
MKTPVCSAPGKLFLGGEYAVLLGAEAVVTAVNRRAVASIARSDEKSTSHIIAAARQSVLDFLSRTPGQPHEVPKIRAKSTGFRVRQKKVGLGSSAAVCAAACGVLFENAALDLETHQAQILDVAMAAHRAAQGGRGSGADVAAAVRGGSLVFSINGQTEPIDISGMDIAVVWSGKAASTAELVEKIEDFCRRDPSGHADCFERLNLEAAHLADAYRRGHGSRIIEVTSRYGAAMGALGRAAGVPIVTKEHALAAHLAADLGGAAKPSGAGGGDVAVAVFKEKDAAKAFRTACLRFSLVPLEIEISEAGLRQECADVAPL